jgi:hypothetical protein
MRWARYAACMENTITVYKVLVRKSEEKKILGKT